MNSSALVRSDPVLAKLEAGRRALASARSVRDVKKIADVAAAGELYARRQQLGEEAIGYAHGVKVHALAKLGALLREAPKAKGAAAGGRRTGLRGSLVEPRNESPTLAAYGVTKKVAAIAQQLAALPAATVEAIASRETTLTEARRQLTRAARPSIVLPKGQYRVLYADPPWQYRDTRTGLGGDGQRVDRAETAAEQDYPTMSVTALARLDVRGLAHDNAVLFCWATFPLLPDALGVVEAWTFTYKTAFVWKKPRGSFGHYHKADAECLLVATRGSCTPDSDQRLSQIIEAPTGGHSRKPEAARSLIDTLYLHGPRLELFARRPAPSPWDTWGNEP